MRTRLRGCASADTLWEMIEPRGLGGARAGRVDGRSPPHRVFVRREQSYCM